MPPTTPKSDLHSQRRGFLDFPREVRDCIYDELLVNRLSAQDQAEYDKILAGDYYMSKFQVQNAIDHYEQKIMIHPADSKGQPLVANALGLLLANKQTHKEANTVLFKRNIWAILIDGEHLNTFWNCGRKICSIHVPCAVHEDNLVQIERLTIFISNERPRSDPQREISFNLSQLLLAHTVKVFEDRNMAFKYLRVRYCSRFRGQIEAVRETLEGGTSLHSGSVFLRDVHGEVEHVLRGNTDEIFKYCEVLGPLTRLSGRVEHIKIHGDLPKAYIDRLTRTIQTNKPTPNVQKAIEKAKMQEAQAEEKRKRSGPTSAAEFVRMMANENPHDQGMPEMADRMENSSHLSPSFFDSLLLLPWF